MKTDKQSSRKREMWMSIANKEKMQTKFAICCK